MCAALAPADNAWELYSLHAAVIFCTVCLPMAHCLHGRALLIYTAAWPAMCRT